jgi:hypothetical protein
LGEREREIDDMDGMNGMIVCRCTKYQMGKMSLLLIVHLGNEKDE